MKLYPAYTIDGHPILGTYAASSLEDLQLAKKVGMNVVLGAHEMLDPKTSVGGFLQENGMKVLYHLTHHIYGMPTLGDALDVGQTSIPLSNRPARPLPERGVVQIDEELIDYDRYTPTALVGCQRGMDGTEAAEHREGTFLFMPDVCRKELEAIIDSPNLGGYYVLDDSPGDALSALKAMYATIWKADGGPSHRVVCAGYGSHGSLCNFAPGVCDLMMIYWYPVTREYDRHMTSDNVQWMLTAARDRVPGMPFLGVYQAFWGDGAGQPKPQQVREQMEDFVREGASGLIAFACRLGSPYSGWAAAEGMQKAIQQAHREIIDTDELTVPRQPEKMAKDRIQEVGYWERPRAIPGLVPAWQVIGPFEDPKHGGLLAVHPPEKEIDLKAGYPGKPGMVHWVKRESCAGFVGLGEIYGDQAYTSYAVAYATCEVASPKRQKVRGLIGSDDDILVWLNGEEVWRHEGVRGVKRDDDSVSMVLPAGTNRVLVKVCNRHGMWGFFMRFADSKGRPLQGLTFFPTA